MRAPMSPRGVHARTRPFASDSYVSWIGSPSTVGRVRVTRDTRQDDYGAQEVTTELCTGIAVDRGWLTFENCKR